MKRTAFQRLFANMRQRRKRARAAIESELLETRVLLSGTACEGEDHDHPVNEFGDELHWSPVASHAPVVSESGYAAPFPLNQTFNLHSLPSANHTIYLDFNGHTTSGTSWNNAFNGGQDFTTPAYDPESDGAAFSNPELETIQEIWQRVSEDFAPFNVNVTTEEPPLSDIIKENSSDTRWGVRVVIGGSSYDWYGNGAGGVAYLTSFNYASDTPTYAFAAESGMNWTIAQGRAKNGAEVISHEVGHTLGLSHDGQNPSTSYYAGHGSGATAWAPIMGNSYTNPVSQWSKGEYTDANQTQDDLSIITTDNGFGYRADDHGSTINTATTIGSTGSGLIERNTDVDMFQFTTTGGSVTIDPFEAGPNLDILATLYNSNGVQIATSNPTGALNASFTGLAAGTYYVSVDGTGQGANGAVGYTDYGSLGQYTITVGGGVVDIDPDDTIASATPYTIGTTVMGTIDDIDPDDVDMYSFSANFGQKLQFDISAYGANPGGLIPEIRLFDASGTQLAIGESTFTYTFSQGGTYYVGVADIANNAYNPMDGTGDANTQWYGDYEFKIAPPPTVGSDLIGQAGSTWWVAESNGVDGFTNYSYGSWNPNAGWQDVQSGDVNGDGYTDVIGRTASGQWWVGVNSNGSYSTQLWGYWVPSLNWTDVHVADVDGDGDSDIVGRASNGDWWVARSDGQSGFINERWGRWSPNVTWSNVMVADIDGDGSEDIIGQTPNGQWWAARSNGQNGFTTELWGFFNPNANFQDIQVGDFNGDGYDDVAGRTGTGAWWIGVSNGDDGFTNQNWGSWAASAGWQDVMVADLNGDGYDDIIGRAQNGQWWAAESTGQGFTREYWGYWVPSLNWQDVNVIDVDQDGNHDLVGRAQNGGLWVARSNGQNFTNQLWGFWSPNGNWQNVMVGNTDTGGSFAEPVVDFDDDEEASIFG